MSKAIVSAEQYALEQFDKFMAEKGFEAMQPVLLAFENWAKEKRAVMEREERDIQTDLYHLRTRGVVAKPEKRTKYFVMPPRKRAAVKSHEMMRMLQRSEQDLQRFVWLCEVSGLDADKIATKDQYEHFEKYKDLAYEEQLNPHDPLRDFDAWSDFQAQKRNTEIEAKLYRLQVTTMARNMLRAFQKLRIPIDIEVTGSVVRWAYSGSKLSSQEEAFLLPFWRDAAKQVDLIYVNEGREPDFPTVVRGHLLDRYVRKSTIARFARAWT